MVEWLVGEKAVVGLNYHWVLHLKVGTTCLWLLYLLCKVGHDG